MARAEDLRKQNAGGSLGAGSGSGDSHATDSDLAAILTAIDEDVGRTSAAVCDGINAEFAARVLHARKTLPRSQIAGALAALNEARKAALTLARRKAQAEWQGRKKIAVIQHDRRPYGSNGGRRKSRDDTSGGAPKPS